MRSLRDLEPGQELECVGKCDSQEADVYLGGALAGILTGTPPGFESADGTWTIETQVQRGRSSWRRWPSPCYTLIVTERARNVEVVRHEESGGSLWWSGAQSPFVFVSGREYIFGWIGGRFGFGPGRTWVFQMNGTRVTRVLTFTTQRFVWNEIRFDVTVGRGARAAEDDLPVLVLLGCRLVLSLMSSTGG